MLYVYSESGMVMLTAVVHSDVAVSASIKIMKQFVEMSNQSKKYSLTGKYLTLLACLQI